MGFVRISFGCVTQNENSWTGKLSETCCRCGVLQTSFGELEKEVFSNFAIIHDMTVATDQQPRPMHEENRERNFAFDSRWLNGTYEFLASSARDESGHCFRQKTIQGWR